MREVAFAFGRALWSQLHPRMLLAAFAPFVVALILWGGLLWVGLQPAVDALQAYFADHDGFRIAHRTLSSLGWDAIHTVIVPLIAMWLLLPLMIFTALLFISLFAMPSVERHVASRHYPQLEKRHGGSMWGSLATSLTVMVIFLFLWVATTPLALIPVLGLLIHPLLWGWMTYRVMSYDALAAHADADERRELLREHRWPLLAMGAAVGAVGTAPTLVWLGGVMWIAVLPLFAAISIWLYVVFFIFSGLWFQHYCLAALAELRSRRPAFIDVNPLDGERQHP